MTRNTSTGRKIFLRGTPEYERLRTAFVNAHVPEKYPREIHKPDCVEDVVFAVSRAKELGVPIGVRSGGHLFTCMSLWQDGLLIDTSNLNRHVVHDEKTHMITYGPAVRVCEISEMLEQVGRFFPHGHAPSVAMGGFSLAGGQGFFMRGWGATVDQWVTELEVVVPDGSIIRANAKENADIFWAARGSGQGFFGVVTKFSARTIPARKFYQRQRAFQIGSDGQLFNEVLALAIQQNDKTPKYGTEVAVCTFYPDKFNTAIEGDEILDPSSLMMSITAAAYVDSMAEAETLLGAFDHVPDNLVKVVAGPAPITLQTWNEVFLAQDMLVPYGSGEIWHIDSILNDPTIPLPKMIEVIKPCQTMLPTRQSVGVIYIGDTYPDEKETAFSLPQQYYISTFTCTKDPEKIPALREWMRKVYMEAERVACGMYVADYDVSFRKSKVMTDSAFERFKEIKDKWDPESRFPLTLYQP